jgi:hypothetical protein
MELLKDKIINKTRKEHRCIVCQDTIPTGSKMNYQVYINDGDIGIVKTCMACCDFINKHYKEIFMDSDPVEFEQIREIMYDKGYLPKRETYGFLKKEK